MKTVEQIYNSIINKFAKLTSLNIRKGSVIDKFTLAVAYAIYYVYQYIEEIRNPHIYTNLKGSDIDSAGILVGCVRQENETDNSYLYRMISWNTNNQCANLTAINNSLMNLTYSSNATYVPLTHGVATGTVYVIPIKLTDDIKEAAINEAKARVSEVSSGSSYIDYVIPKILKVQVNCYLSVYKAENDVTGNISAAFEKYINNIAPGSYLEIGELNKIGTTMDNVNYFNISEVIIDNEIMMGLEKLQTLKEKFVFDKINWNMVVR